MKKLLLLAIIFLTAMTASAQVAMTSIPQGKDRNYSSADSQIGRGFRTGIRVNLGLGSITGEEVNNFGFGADWIAEYNFSKSLFLQSGVGFNGSTAAFFAQIPVHIGYRFALSDNLSMFIQAGPTFGYGLFGDYLDKKFDLGLGGRIGLEISKFQFGFSSNGGLLNASEGYDSYYYSDYYSDEGGGHYFSFLVSAAYMF